MSHEDFFIKNKVVILQEERMAWTVRRLRWWQKPRWWLMRVAHRVMRRTH